jgi:hypothetical protein
LGDLATKLLMRAVVAIVVLLLGIELAGLIAGTLASSIPPAAGAGGRAPAAKATPARAAIPGAAAGVVRTVARVEHAFNAGDVRLLCRPGALVDPAVIRGQDGQAGCQSELETLMADKSPLQLTVDGVSLKADLATAVVATRLGTTATVDLVRGGSGWLLSFSDGDDPMPALAGTT